MADLKNTLKERGNRYGPFEGHAFVSQSLQTTIKTHMRRASLNGHAPVLSMEDQVVVDEAISMVCHKLGRIANGDPMYDDSWHDIAGYATLVVKHIQGKENGDV